MAYKVKIESFEGPFDLLLYLVSKKKINIGAVSVAEIADQYLYEVSKMNALDLDVASDFLLVAATLLELKAQAMLPKETTDIDEEISDLSPSAARDILIERLITYKQYKNATDELYSRYRSTMRTHERTTGPDGDLLGLMPDFLKDVTLDSLGFIACECFARKEIFLLESDHIAAKPIPVETHVRSIHDRIRTAKRLKFSELIAGHRKAEFIVVSFLAVLELYKRQMVDLKQEKTFGDIDISYIEGSGELVLDKDEIDSAY